MLNRSKKLKVTPIQLVEYISELLDLGFNPLEVRNLMQTVSKIDKELARYTIQAFAEFTHLTPQKQTLLKALHESGLYFEAKNTSVTENESISCPFLLDTSDSVDFSQSI